MTFERFIEWLIALGVDRAQVRHIKSVSFAPPYGGRGGDVLHIEVTTYDLNFEGNRYAIYRPDGEPEAATTTRTYRVPADVLMVPERVEA